jgi:hypothetical protein
LTVRFWRLLQLFGLAFLIVVVLTHVAEQFRLLSQMGWGQPKSAGHYVDLASAVLGCTLLSLGTIGSIIVRRQKSRLRRARAKSTIN